MSPRADAPTRSIRTIQSPTVGQVYGDGPEKGQPKPPFEGTFLGQRFIQGVADVDEEADWPCLDPDTLQPRHRPTWHWLVQDFGMTDLTDTPPRYPLTAPEPDDAELDRLTAPSL